MLTIEVDNLLKVKSHKLIDVITELRNLILSIDDDLMEHIKWNSPAYFYNGAMKPFNPKEYKRDLLVLHVNKPNEVLLVFPTGNKIEVSAILEDENIKDGRKLLRIKSEQEFNLKKDMITEVIKKWLSLIEK